MSEICEVCGNYKQGGVCRVCQTMQSSRAKGFRRGDKGGMRPERRNFNTQSSSPLPSSKRTEIQNINRSDNSFYLSLQGEWYSDQAKVKISIDLIQHRWVFKFANGKRLTQYWKLKSKSLNKVCFTRNKAVMTVKPGSDGALLFSGKKGFVPFYYEKDGQRLYLCQNCLTKSEQLENYCQVCGHPF